MEDNVIEEVIKKVKEVANSSITRDKELLGRIEAIEKELGIGGKKKENK